MKKTLLGMFCLLSAVAFAGDFDREEHILAGEIYKNFPWEQHNHIKTALSKLKNLESDT